MNAVPAAAVALMVIALSACLDEGYCIFDVDAIAEFPGTDPPATCRAAFEHMGLQADNYPSGHNASVAARCCPPGAYDNKEHWTLRAAYGEGKYASEEKARAAVPPMEARYAPWFADLLTRFENFTGLHHVGDTSWFPHLGPPLCKQDWQTFSRPAAPTS